MVVTQWIVAFCVVWMDGPLGGWIDGWWVGSMIGSVDRQMDGWMESCLWCNLWMCVCFTQGISVSLFVGGPFMYNNTVQQDMTNSIVTFTETILKGVPLYICPNIYQWMTIWLSLALAVLLLLQKRDLKRKLTAFPLLFPLRKCSQVETYHETSQRPLAHVLWLTSPSRSSFLRLKSKLVFFHRKNFSL